LVCTRGETRSYKHVQSSRYGQRVLNIPAAFELSPSASPSLILAATRHPSSLHRHSLSQYVNNTHDVSLSTANHTLPCKGMGTRGHRAIPATLTHLCHPHRSRPRLVRPLPWLPAAASCWSRWRRVTSHWPPTAATSGSQLCHLGPQPAETGFQHVTCPHQHTSA
jgi:hypothetical protein